MIITFIQKSPILETCVEYYQKVADYARVYRDFALLRFLSIPIFGILPV